MEYRKITNDIFVSVQNLRTDTETNSVKAELEYFQGQPTDSQSSLCEIGVRMSDEFIEDTYHLTGLASEQTRANAALDLGERIYNEKGIPKKFNNVIASTNGLRYTA